MHKSYPAPTTLSTQPAWHFQKQHFVKLYNCIYSYIHNLQALRHTDVHAKLHQPHPQLWIERVRNHVGSKSQLPRNLPAFQGLFLHHVHSQHQHLAWAPSTGTLSPRRSQHQHPVSTTRTASSQHPAPAPGTGTLSPPRAHPAPTGTQSPPHSDIGFRLTQFPGEKEWHNGKAKSPINWRCLNIGVSLICSDATAARERRKAAKGKFRGGIMQTTMKQNVEKWSHSLWKTPQVHTETSLSACRASGSFVGHGPWTHAMSPCFEIRFGGGQPFGTGFDTHTVPLCGARANDLNRYLKALETKERNTERAALRGQERKVGRQKLILSPWLG